MAVVEHGSIRAAARRLGLAQSGLTQQMKRLESSLNVELFSRGHSGIVLTSAGTSLLARARIILTECARAQHEVRGTDQELTGALSIGASSEAFAQFLAPVIIRFRKQFPRVTVHVASGPSAFLMSRIREGHLDFACTLVSLATDMRDLSAVTLDAARPVIVCRKGHPLQGATTLAQLQAAEWVTTAPPGKPGTPSNRVYDLFANAGDEPPSVVLTVESLFDTLTLLVDTDLLFLAPAFVFETSGFGAALATIAIDAPIPSANLSLLQRADVPLPPAAREMAAMTVSYASLLRRRAARVE